MDQPLSTHRQAGQGRTFPGKQHPSRMEPKMELSCVRSSRARSTKGHTGYREGMGKRNGRHQAEAATGRGQGEASLKISAHNNCNAIVFYVPDPTRIEACRGPRGRPAHYLPKHVCRTAVQKIPACLISKKSLVLSPQSVL